MGKKMDIYPGVYFPEKKTNTKEKEKKMSYGAVIFTFLTPLMNTSYVNTDSPSSSICFNSSTASSPTENLINTCTKGFLSVF